MKARGVVKGVALGLAPLLWAASAWAQSSGGGGSAGRTVGYVVGVGVVIVLAIRALRGKK